MLMLCLHAATLFKIKLWHRYFLVKCSDFCILQFYYDMPTQYFLVNFEKFFSLQHYEKRDSTLRIFLLALRKFQEHLFCRPLANDCFYCLIKARFFVNFYCSLNWKINCYQRSLLLEKVVYFLNIFHESKDKDHITTILKWSYPNLQSFRKNIGF